MISLTEQFNRRGKINAPTFIYKILYNKEPPGGFLFGRGADHGYKLVDGVPIDKEIPTKAFREINKLSQIETRSSCQGSDETRPTFLIFRTIEQDRTNIARSVKKINKYPDIKAGFDLGQMRQYRIGVTTNLWYDKDPEAFKKWWYELPEKINACF